MKKTLFISFLVLILLTGCGSKSKGIDEKLENCLIDELTGFVHGNVEEIPLSDIMEKDTEKIEYYRGVVSKEHPELMYLIVYPKNGLYDASVMSAFDYYFSSRFDIFQKMEIDSVTIYVHTINNNDASFEYISNKCLKKYEAKTSKIPTDTLDKLDSTNRIVFKMNEKILGETQDKGIIKEVLNGLASSKKEGENCLEDGYGLSFEMYDGDNLIDTIYVWNDGKRVLPASLNDCYYTISNEIDFRKTVEKITDFIFYTLMDYTGSCDDALELIATMGDSKYYLSCIKSDKVLIKFMTSSEVMTLKYAIEHYYISPEVVANDYPDILIKK